MLALPRRTLLIGIAAALASVVSRRPAAAATCTGATPCNACKNCSSCAHCKKRGGTCGACRRAMEDSHRSGDPQ